MKQNSLPSGIFMPDRKRRLSPLLLLGAMAVLLAATAQGSHASWRMQSATHPPPIARFEPQTGETRLASQVTPGLCFSLALPQEWRLTGSDDSRTTLTAPSGAELEAFVRSAREVRDRPEPDLASRDAAFLQRDHESLFGRPAQAVRLASLASGAARWTATWVDPNLPSPARAVTVDTFIVPISGDWILELSLTNVEVRDAYEALAAKILSSLTIGQGGACAGSAP